MSRNPAGLLCYSRLGAKGGVVVLKSARQNHRFCRLRLNLATVIRERKVCNSIASVRGNSAPSVTCVIETLSQCCIVTVLQGAISVELCSMVKCALWGLRGRTPYKSYGYRIGLLIKFRCGRCVLRALVPPPSSLQLFDVSPVALSLDRSCRSVVSSSSLLLAHSSWLYVSC